MLRVVSNSGPLITLSRTGYLYLLPLLFGKVLVPDAVYEEVIGKGKNRPGMKEFEEASWLDVKEVEHTLALNLLRGQLDIGEAEAIVLAQELNAHLLLVDDLKARRLALLSGLRIGGTISVLIAGIKKNLISESPEIIIQRLKRGGMYISDKIAAYLLKEKSQEPL